jgi:DNA-binding transcriptional MocR family regulator
VRQLTGRDGTKFPTGARSASRKLCDCHKRGIYRCDYLRLYTDRFASWGWDGYRECFVHGHAFYELTAASSPFDLPICPKRGPMVPVGFCPDRCRQKWRCPQMLFAAAKPGIISFAMGLPAPELFPIEGLMAASSHVLANDPQALQYGPPYQPLRRQIVDLMAKRKVVCVDITHSQSV